MRSSIVAAVLIAPALIGARPLATPGTKMVLNPDTYSPPQFSGAPMPAEHTSPHHFADGVTDEDLKRMMRGHDKTLATPKEEIIVHPYRPFADPTKDRDREHSELFEKVHPRDFHQNMRNTDNMERPHPDDHHLGPKIGTPKNARATDYTKVLPHPSGNPLPPKIGTPINARAIDNTERPHPNDHHLGPKIGTPKNARAIDGTERFPRPNGNFLPPKIGTPINARAIHGTERLTRPDGMLETPSWGGPVGNPIDTPIGEISIEDEDVERPHPSDHHLGPMIGSPTNARAIDNAERPPHPNDHHLGPKIGTPINAKREESEKSEEFGDPEEIPVDLPISSDYYPDYDPEEFDDLEEVPVDLPISMDYYPDYDPEEFDGPEEMPVDLPIISDYHPESSDYEDSRYIPPTPGDRNVGRPGRLAGPPYPCAGPVHFNGTGFNSTINGTAFNNTINGTASNNATNITTEASNCSDRAASDSKKPVEPALNRRGQGHSGALPDVIQSFENQRKQQAQKAAQDQAAKDKASKEKADKEKASLERKAREKESKEKNRGSPGKNRPNKPSPNIMDHAPELFEYLKDPFNKPFPYEDDKEFSEAFFGNLDKLRHPLYWAPGGDKTEHPKQEPGHEWPEKPRPKTTYEEKGGFYQGDGWKTDYWQKGVGIQQPRVPEARRPYWTEGNPVY